jgi:hypothetical protein
MNNKGLLFGLVFLLMAAIALANPNYLDQSVIPTTNGSQATFSTYWYSNTSNLSCFVFQTDNTGTATNHSTLCLGNVTESWTNFTIVLNSTLKSVTWVIYANDTDGAENLSSQVLSITEYHQPIYQTNVCPVTTDLQTTLLYIAIGVFILAIFVISEILPQLPAIFGFVPAIGMLFYSFPMYGCQVAFGATLTIFAIVMLVNVWQKAANQLGGK